MRKEAVILCLWILCVAGKGQEYNFSSVLPNPSIFERDSVLDPYSLKSIEPGKSSFSRKDSTYYFYWSIADSLWLNATSSIYYYNEDNRRDTTLSREWGPGTWINRKLYEYFYDDKGNVENMIQKYWSTGEPNWINSEQNLYFFNEYQNLSSYIVQHWNESQLSWEDVYKYLYDYDFDQQLIYQEKQTWNPDSLKWISNYRFLWTYQNGLMVEEMRQNWSTIDSVWINFVRDEYQYNQYGNLEKDIQSVWEPNDSVWEEKTVISFSYSQDEQVSEKLYQSWVNGFLVNFTLYTYQYTPMDQLLEIRSYIWENSAWDTSFMYFFDYDLHGNLIREGSRDWSSGDGVWINNSKWEYYYTHFIEPLFAFISDSTNISCYGYSDGTATVMITGGTPPYTIFWNDPQSTTIPTVFGLSADQYYTVTVTDANLNTASDSIMLSQPPEIITGPIYGEVNVNQNNTVTYRVESDPSSFYSWFVTHGEILSAQGGDTIVVKWAEPGQGEVSVFETTTNGCEGDTVHVFVSISPTSIAKPRSSHLQIYPNPANQWITVQTATIEFRPWNLEILDMTGKTIQSFHSITQNKFLIPLENLSQGIYFFRITNSSGIEMRKVVIER